MAHGGRSRDQSLDSAGLQSGFEVLHRNSCFKGQMGSFSSHSEVNEWSSVARIYHMNAIMCLQTSMSDR